jgi:Bifunctional DNA primase/polymerase, N-terminal
VSALPEALGYARQGNHVLPCITGTKEPAPPGGVYAATVDPEQLEQWWTWWPDANVAVAAQPSQLVFADLDRRPGHDGVTNFAQLLDDHELDWPKTKTTVTPSDSRHLWFTRPTGVDLVGRTLAPGVQLIANGYALAPSSTVNGRHYRFTVDVPPVELPAPLARLCQRTRPRDIPAAIRPSGTPDRAALRALDRDPQRVARAEEGCRNNTFCTGSPTGWAVSSVPGVSNVSTSKPRSPQPDWLPGSSRPRSKRHSRPGSTTASDPLYLY